MTRASALDGIRTYGLKPAGALRSSAGHGNRTTWTEVRLPSGAPAWLRWQRMGDEVLQRRLHPPMEPAQWRAFIDSMVFLFPTSKQAEGLLSYPIDRGIEQTVIAFETAALLASGHKLQVCRWNNGFPDRSRPPRLRSCSDYRPAAEWVTGNISEVVVPGGIASTVRFRVMDGVPHRA